MSTRTSIALPQTDDEVMSYLDSYQDKNIARSISYLYSIYRAEGKSVKAALKATLELHVGGPPRTK